MHHLPARRAGIPTCHRFNTRSLPYLSERWNANFSVDGSLRDPKLPAGRLAIRGRVPEVTSNGFGFRRNPATLLPNRAQAEIYPILIADLFRADLGDDF